MAYDEYADSGRSVGKCLYQLSKLHIPLHIVESVVFYGNEIINYNNKEFAKIEWNERNEPIFLFKGEFADFNKNIKQSKIIILMGNNPNLDLLPLDQQTNQILKFTPEYIKVGGFTDCNGLAFKDACKRHSKFYLADIEGKPLREQVLTTTTFEDKFNRLKNKFATREIKHY